MNMPVDGLKETPAGSAPDKLKAGAGNPVTVAVNAPPVPTVKIVELGLVIAGA